MATIIQSGRFGAAASDLFVSATTVINTTSTIAVPATVQVGDLLIVCKEFWNSSPAAPTGGSGGAWTASGHQSAAYLYDYYLYYRLAASGDSGANLSLSNSTGTATSLLVYRGPTIATIKNYVENTTTVTNTGITKAGGSKFILGIAHSRDPAFTMSYTSGFGAPQTRVNNVNGTYFRQLITDCTAANYTNGTNLVHAVAGGAATDISLVELT